MIQKITSQLFPYKKDSNQLSTSIRGTEHLASISKTSLKPTRRKAFLIWFAVMTLYFLFVSALPSAASFHVTFAWDPNSEFDLAGYRAYCREESEPYDYTNPIWEGAETTCTIYDLHETKAYCFVVRAYDTEGFESADSEELCLSAETVSGNQAPIADAGPDQTVSDGHLVTLNGSNSTDVDDGIVSYHWVQTSGYLVDLSDHNIKKPTFTAPDINEEGVSLTFQLTVVDHNGLNGVDSCVVNVTWLNEPPQARAGVDQTVNEGDMVTINGSASVDIDGGIASYLWTQISGLPVALSNPTSQQPRFSAQKVGPNGASLTFKLTVTDTGGLKDTDTCIVNISFQNNPPVAVVEGYIETYEGDVVILDGSRSSDNDNGIVSYLWTQIDGRPVTLSNPTSQMTTFVVPETDQFGSNMAFKLTVTDLGGLQSAADCFVYVLLMPNNIQDENVIVTFRSYMRKYHKLVVAAVSDFPGESNTLTAWANYGPDTIKLGELRYWAAKKIYCNTFKNVSYAPDTITITSVGGASDSKQCFIR